MSTILELKPVNVHHGPLSLPHGASKSGVSCGRSANLQQMADKSVKWRGEAKNSAENDMSGNRDLDLSHNQLKSKETEADPLKQLCPPFWLISLENPKEVIQRLEGNLHFLTENYTQMLADLHKEIESLNIKNRELQFQLVTGLPLQLDMKDNPGERVAHANDTKLRNRISDLQAKVEHLENALTEARGRNSYYKNLVEELKRHSKPSGKLRVDLKSELTKSVDKWSAKHFSELPLPYARRFKEYEDTIQQLRKENDQLKQEMSARQERERTGGPRRQRQPTTLPRIDIGKQLSAKIDRAPKAQERPLWRQ